LQGVAEGDLTQQATVTEDITGAIADSVNYTVEELRTLVSQVQGTVGRVTVTIRAGRGQLDRAARDLVRAAARDPRQPASRCCRWPAAFNHVSTQAQETAGVARQSLLAAESGLKGRCRTRSAA